MSVRIAKKTVVAALALMTFGPAFSCADNTVFNLWTGLDASGFRRRDTFYTDTTTIVCGAQYVAARNDITFNAVVRYIKDQNGAAADSVSSVAELAPGISRGQLTLTLSPPQPPPNVTSSGTEPFLVGTYRCEWYVDSLPPAGGAKGAKGDPCSTGLAMCGDPWKVVYPDCPVDYAHANYRCGGFYKVGASCPGEVKGQTCTCPGAGETDVWTCQ